MGNIPGGLAMVFVIVVIVCGVIFILREVTCWYFKLNRIVELLEKIASDKGAIKEDTEKK